MSWSVLESVELTGRVVRAMQGGGRVLLRHPVLLHVPRCEMNLPAVDVSATGGPWTVPDP